MNVTEKEIREFSEGCTQQMGDIFWDRDSYDPDGQDYAEPAEVAAETIRECMTQFLRTHGAQLIKT